MSRTSKIFLASSIVATSFTVFGVHWLQQKERDASQAFVTEDTAPDASDTTQTMFAGVLRDDARQQAKKAERLAREQEFQEQIRRRKYLESTQAVSNASEGSSPLGGPVDQKLKLEPMDEVEFQGCKTC